MILLRVRYTHETQLHKTHTHTKGKKLVNKTKKKFRVALLLKLDQTKIPPTNSPLPKWRKSGLKGKKKTPSTHIFIGVKSAKKGDTLATTSQGSKEKFLLKTLVYTLTC